MSTADADNPVSAEARRPLVRAKRVEGSPLEPIRAKRVESEVPAPGVRVPTPGVVSCFRVFCSIVAFGAIIGAGCSFIPLSNNFYNDSDNDGIAEFIGFLFLALSIFTIFCIPVLFARSQPWMWWYGLFVLLLTTLSLYLTIFGIVLLVFWVQPRTQQFFGRRVEVATVPNRRHRHDDDDFDD